jgi:hypothetical protein
MEGLFAIVFLFGGGTLFLLSVSPVGRALAERIRSGGTQVLPDPQLQAEVDALRAEVSELHERVDFAERLLAQRPEAGKIGAGE